MPPTANIAIYVADADAAKWLVFQQHYDTFDILVNSGVFNVRNGSVSLHFDREGVLKTINRADLLYSERYAGVENRP